MSLERRIASLRKSLKNWETDEERKLAMERDLLTLRKVMASPQEYAHINWGGALEGATSDAFRSLITGKHDSHSRLEKRAIVAFSEFYSPVVFVQPGDRVSTSRMPERAWVSLNMLSLSYHRYSYYVLLTNTKSYSLETRELHMDPMVLPLTLLGMTLHSCLRKESDPLRFIQDPRAGEFRELATVWDCASQLGFFLLQHFQFREHEYKRFMGNQLTAYSDRHFYIITAEVYAILYVRKLLGLENPVLDTPWITKNPFYAIPDGPLPMPSHPALDLVRSTFDWDALVEEGIALLEPLPDVILDVDPKPPTSVGCNLSDDAIASLLMSGREEDVQTVVKEASIEVEWNEPGAAVIEKALMCLPPGSATSELSDSEVFVDVVIFGRKGRIKVRTSQGDDGEELPPSDIMVKLNKLLQPEYQIYMFAHTEGWSDPLYLIRPKDWFEHIRTELPHQFKKVFKRPTM